jgi:GNAT superfamily N-acetyltransferase
VTENPYDATFFKLRYHPPHNEMWVYYLQVASSFRRRGLGRRLLQAIECVAHELGVQTISVLPLPHAVSFWKKMGYRQHPDLSRVLTKTLT